MKNRWFRFALRAFVVLSISSSTLWAGDGEWSRGGPFGGRCDTTLVDPTDATKVYATCAGQIFTSVDGGTSWQLSNLGLHPAPPNAAGLALDPVTPSTLYLGASPGIYKSTDSGANWSLVFDGAPAGFDFAIEIAVAPSNPSTVYAVLSSSGILLSGFYRSLDAGATWQQQPVNLGTFPFAIAVAPDDGTVLYVNSVSSGTFKSSDGGASFSSIGVGMLPFDTRDVLVDPGDSSVVYVGTVDGVYKSTDAGATFGLVGSSEILGTALHIPSDASGTLFSASSALGASPASVIHRSTDGGASWTAVPFARSRANDLAGPTTRLFAASSVRGLFRSLDSGATWSEANDGLGGAEIDSLTPDPVAAQTVYSTGPGGLFKSTDGGDSWLRSENGLGTAFETSTGARRVVVDPQTPATLYAGFGLSVYRSLDGAASWSEISSATASSLEMLSVNPSDSLDLLAGAFGTPVWRSQDAGATWNPSSAGLPTGTVRTDRLWRDPSDAAVLYVQLEPGGLYQSVDSGANWAQVAAAPLDADAFAIDPTDPLVLFLGFESGSDSLLKSIDGGLSWAPAASGLVGGVADLWFSPPGGPAIYARADGIFKSIDGGASWTLVAPPPVQPNSGGPITLMEALALPNRPETLLAATQFHGVLSFSEAFFADGFESGDTTAWSTVVP